MYGTTLSVADVSRVAATLGIALSADDVHEMVVAADIDGDGAVGFDDFRAVLRQRA